MKGEARGNAAGMRCVVTAYLLAKQGLRYEHGREGMSEGQKWKRREFWHLFRLRVRQPPVLIKFRVISLLVFGLSEDNDSASFTRHCTYTVQRHGILTYCIVQHKLCDSRALLVHVDPSVLFLLITACNFRANMFFPRTISPRPCGTCGSRSLPKVGCRHSWSILAHLESHQWQYQ